MVSMVLEVGAAPVREIAGAGSLRGTMGNTAIGSSFGLAPSNAVAAHLARNA
jgi:hypothetical protein